LKIYFRRRCFQTPVFTGLNG